MSRTIITGKAIDPWPMMLREGNLPVVVRLPSTAVLTDYILMDFVYIPMASSPVVPARPEPAICGYGYRACRFGITLWAMLVI